MGMKKTPQPFIAACNKFVYIEVISHSLESEQVKVVSPESASIVEKKSVSPLKEGTQQQIEYVPEHNKETEKVPAFLSNIGEAVDSVANDSGWSQLGDVGNLLVKKDPAFDTRNFGFKKLSSLIEAYPSYFDQRNFWKFLFCICLLLGHCSLLLLSCLLSGILLWSLLNCSWLL